MKFISIIILLISSTFLSAQELNCQVNIQSDPGLDITTKEKEVITQLQQSVFELINSTTWTQDNYEVEERINCALQISITKISGDNFEASMQVQSTRPVFNSSYNTTLFNFLDKEVNFTFREGAKFIYSDNQYTDNLTSIIAFYAYYILGLDGDSFALKGGSKYLKKAQDIVILAQKGMMPGWKADEKGKKNRYWLVENQLQQLFEPLRECFYEYHRKGLDNMFNNQQLGRDNITEALQNLVTVNKARPGSVNVLNFAQTKKKELIGIFKEAGTKQKSEAVNLLKLIDPTNSSEYQEILE